jgi:hypothetical protein
MFSRDHLKRAASLTEEDFVQLGRCVLQAARPDQRLRAAGTDEHLHLPEPDPGVHKLLAGAACLLAILCSLHLLNTFVLLFSVFLIGVGFACNAPAWSAIVPGIVTDKELPSAMTLAGLQLNISGIIGPASLSSGLRHLRGVPGLIHLVRLVMMRVVAAPR